MVTLKQVAAKVGVSATTVSLYVNDKNTKRISAEKKRAIQKAIDELRYYPDTGARSLKNKTHKSIGIILPFQGTFLRSSFIAEIVSGIQSVLFRNDYSFAFLPATSTHLSEVIGQLVMNHNDYDGFIIVGTRLSTIDDIRESSLFLKSRGLRFVVMNMPPLGIDVNQVTTDFSALVAPLKYLEDMGHTDILLIHGVQTSPDTIYVKEQLARTGRSYHEIYGAYEREIARTALEAYVDANGIDFTAVYSLSDTMALGVYDYFGERKVRIPDDVSVIGRNDSFFDTLIRPNLTTARRNSFVEGEKAATILLTSFDTDTALVCSVPGDLVVRDSVKSLIERK